MHISRNGYIPKLQWISKKFVVLWDEGDKRGWLVNGTTALLHLVRASLEVNNADSFKFAFLFNSKDITEAPEPYTTQSANHVLPNPENMKLKIYPEKDDFIRFQDRVEHMYGVLEKMIDHEVELAGQSGINVKPRLRKHLEGWDFTDLATDRDPFYARLATLPTIGKGWIDFTREIHAINLFGRGFGDIIRPVAVDGSHACVHWAVLPKGRYYLAACISDLKEVMQMHGAPNSDPMKLSPNMVWYDPGDIFAPCQCAEDSTTHSDPVQVPLRLSFFRKLSPKGKTVPLQNCGAVVFGHNRNFKWYWTDSGDPVQGDALSPLEESEAAAKPEVEERTSMTSSFTSWLKSKFHDSGIGSSVGSSSSLGRGSQQSSGG